MPRLQHAVTKDIAGHVADPDNGEVGRLDVGAELAEVALDEFPGATRGDADRLVVVARRATRGKRVAEPEPVGNGDLVSGVRKGRGALVGGDDEIGIVV